MVASPTMGIHPAAINGDVVPSFITVFLIYHRSSCKVSAQIQLRALQRYFDKRNPTTTIVKGVYDWKPYKDCKTRSDLVQKTKHLGDVKDEHDFCEETSCSGSE